MFMITLEVFARGVSLLCGWLYVLLWSLSFYSQPVLNFRRRSTQGLAFDWPLLNVYGAACYTINSALFLYSASVRREYAARHPSAPEPTTRFNDFCFGLHSLILCTITASQFWPSLWQWTGTQGDRRVAGATSFVFWSGLFAIAASISMALVQDNSERSSGRWGWIDVAYIMGNIKLLITIVKFIPQIASNHQRKSTEGVAMSGVLLDFVGGILSLLQLSIDSILQGDWSGVTANPAKFGLADLSMLADIVFMVQHYVLYGSRHVDSPDDRFVEEGPCDEIDPLLKRSAYV